MRKTTALRRYAPLFVIAAIQLLIILVVPSTAPSFIAGGAGQTATSSVAGAAGASGLGAPAGVGGAAQPTAVAGAPSTGSTGQPVNAAVPGTEPSAGVAAVPSAGQSAAPVKPGAKATGSRAPTTRNGKPGTTSTTAGAAGGGARAALADTTHCTGGREFDPALAYWAPPCVPGTPGGSYPDNGGATSTGVTGSEITVVDYVGTGGPEIDTLLKATGFYESYADAQVLDAAYANFLNTRYVTFGRRINIITYQGQCTTVPPDTNCLIPEMDKVASTYHPYAVVMNMTLCSACYAELARDKVVVVGGAGFSDALANANAPYFYSEVESSTRVETAFAEFYCKQLANSPVKFAETNNPAQNFNGQKRVLGIMGINDPDNQNTVRNVLIPLLAKCGVSVNHTYFWAQNVNTAEQQASAAIAAMDTSTNPANTVICLCDPLEPEFFYQGEQQNAYYPETVIASDQAIDTDVQGQGYESGVSCPAGGQCPFDLAYGIGDVGTQQPPDNDEGTRIYAAGGGKNLPVGDGVNEATAQIYVMLGNLIEGTGPDLTPQNMQAQAPNLGTVGGGNTGEPLLGFGTDNYQWTQDVRVSYWDRQKISGYNKTAGSYVPIEGGRFALGSLPTLDNPPIPAARVP